MKRIISLILVAVIAVAALTGCAYNYAKDDMSSYATFDAEKFKAALIDFSLEIDDGSFGTDATERENKVNDAIFSELATKASADDKKYEGVLGAYDVLYYVYYCTDAEGHIFFADKMQLSAATKLQLGLSSTKGYQKTLYDALKDKDVKDYIYDTVTTGNTKAGDIVFVSYTLKYTDYVYGANGEIEKNEDGSYKTYQAQLNVKNQMLVLNQSGENEPHVNAFIDKLISKEGAEVKVNTNLTDFSIDWTAGDKAVDVADATGEYKYTGVKVNWVVKDNRMNKLTEVKDTTYTTPKKEYDIYGNVQYDLKDKELTYHIFPVYYLEVAPALTADVVLDEFYSALLSQKTDDNGDTVYSIDFVQEKIYKNGTEELIDILTELKGLQDSLASAESATATAKKDRDTKKATVDGKENPSEADRTNLALAEQTLAEAESKEAEAREKVAGQKAKVLACTAEGRDISTDLVNGYWQYRYNALLDTYKLEIKNNLAKAIFAKAKDIIEYKTGSNGFVTLPKKAVNQAYDRLMNSYKFDFYERNYTEADADKNIAAVTNYAHYSGNLDSFLKDELKLSANATKQQIEDAIGAKAEAHVKELILVYSLAEVYGADVAVTDDEIDEFKQGWRYWLYWYSAGGEDNIEENDIVNALQLDKILNYLLEEKPKDANSQETRVEYIRVKYKIKGEDSSAE